ncbi:hypothetical protein [Desulfoluna butyratoxydans]|uniref:Uncharacterized protein n=1 Tax=Desulfoluna butyratoxydans TaxID=231438 RepID=A0A4U8YQK7_9BACT|nr:hypothetical protein [Desulfoluna butyratoxydans]VFQ46565.1 hypothetical protein MSL71_42320 [Desulfoluna butyratoxydans]
MGKLAGHLDQEPYATADPFTWEDVWIIAVSMAEGLELDGLHVKVVEAITETVLFEWRWCAGNVTPFMRRENETGFLAGFVVPLENGSKVEILFERDKSTHSAVSIQKHIEFLKEFLVLQISRFCFRES